MAPTRPTTPGDTPKGFPRAFWTANTTELFERAAYYAVASFVVIYLGQMGLGDYWPSTINSLLWGVIYFLPILSGTIADRIGFRKALLGAFLVLVLGYLAMGAPLWLGWETLSETIESEVTAGPGSVAFIILGVMLIGAGGSFVKPCISGTVQKTAVGKATLGFAIFYMVVNIGSLVGRGTSYTVRTQTSLDMIFAVGAAAAVTALVLVALLYRLPKDADVSEAQKKKPVGQILRDMVVVLKNPRFSLFLLVTSGFWFLYTQVYNVIPLYLKKVVETNPAVDIYTMANPFVIVAFQLLITKLFGKMKPVRSIIVGAVIIGLSMMVNVIPLAFDDGVRMTVWDLLPFGALMATVTVALIAFGELFTAARAFEYIGALAPKGQEGLFLGYANLPTAIGALLGGPVGAYIFNDIMAKGATKRPDGLLDLDPFQSFLGWAILMAVGFLTAISIWVFNRWLVKQQAEG